MLFDLDSIIQLSNRSARTISQLSDSSGIFEINPFHFRRAGSFFSPFFLFLAKQIDNVGKRVMLSGIPDGWRSHLLSCFTCFRYSRSVQKHMLTRGNSFEQHTDEKIVVRCMHKLAHTQFTEQTISTVFMKRQGTFNWKQNAHYAGSRSEHSLTMD